MIDPASFAPILVIVAFASFAAGMAIDGLSRWFFPRYRDDSEHFDGDVL